MTMTALDYEEVRQLLARYCHALDFEDGEAFADCFAPDGVFEGISQEENLTGQHVGRAELQAFAAHVAEYMAGHVRHSSISSLIEGDGTAAKAISYAHITRDYGPAFGRGQLPHVGMIGSGLYFDDLIKIEGRWFFARRCFRYSGHADVTDRVGKPLEIGRVFASTNGTPQPAAMK